ncbi:TOMM precursor leader peptide-binding protein [Granulosicoccus sp. 3-233]|uniref:TOMM precursor leader peptide-binding protein n=1 Tax=Granulosicoccus sp. 3-233 TaxID=3417969 RepID=UPI003D3584E8
MDAEATAYPRFKSSVNAIVDPDDGLFLLCEGRYAWMPERIFKALAPMLNGNHPVESIFSKLADTHAARDVLGALDRLRKGGYLAEDATVLEAANRAFWELSGTAPSRALHNLQQSSLSIRLIGTTMDPATVSILTECLAEEGITVQQDADCSIVITDDYLHPELQSWNAQSLESGHSWILVKPRGLQSWMGPAFMPGRSACWQCLAQRLRWHRRVDCYLGAAAETPPGAPAAGLNSSLLAQLLEVAAEVTRWLATDHSALLDRVVSTNLLTLERRHHILVRRPQCQACGNGLADLDREDAMPRIRSQRKVSKLDGGGYRVMSAEAMAAQLEHHVSPITGIVGNLEVGRRSGPTTPVDHWMTPTYSADHNFNDMHDGDFMLYEGLRRRSGGKGKHAAQARASAVGESLERYSGVFDGTEVRQRASFDALAGEAIHPNVCMGYSQEQYRNRQLHNQRQHKAHWVPEPFDSSAQIDWSPLWSLTTGRRRFLPTSYCYFGYRSSDSLFARADSNGCAAGAVLEEAMLQGVLELIERDAVAIWWYNRIERPAVDLQALKDEYGRELQKHYQSLGRDLWVLDVTSDIGIPVYAALSRRTDKPQEDIIYGFGCHLDPEIALLRSLTELNQSLEAVPMAAGEASSQEYLGTDEAIHWWQTVRLDENPYLGMPRASSVRSPGCRPHENLASGDLSRDLRTCVDALAHHGLDTLVLDQTRPDVGLPVTRIVVPGLRHFWARFAEGRLYDVPVQQGWLREPLTENQLNPFVIQF